MDDLQRKVDEQEATMHLMMQQMTEKDAILAETRQRLQEHQVSKYREADLYTYSF